MSRRKPVVKRIRTTSQATELISPLEARRLYDAALTGIRSAEFGTMAGRLHLAGKLTATDIAIAKRWLGLVAAYDEAMQAPKPPVTVSLEIGSSGMSPDPDSITGQKQLRRHQAATLAWLEGRDALRKAGRLAERAVEDIAVCDRVPEGWQQLEQLKAGLRALGACWSAKRKR